MNFNIIEVEVFVEEVNVHSVKERKSEFKRKCKEEFLKSLIETSANKTGEGRWLTRYRHSFKDIVSHKMT